MNGNPTDDPMNMTLMMQSMFNPNVRPGNSGNSGNRKRPASNDMHDNPTDDPMNMTFMMQSMFNPNSGTGNYGNPGNARRPVDAYDMSQYNKNEGVEFNTPTRFSKFVDTGIDRKKRDLKNTQNAYVPDNDDHWFGNVRASNSL